MVPSAAATVETIVLCDGVDGEGCVFDGDGFVGAEDVDGWGGIRGVRDVAVPDVPVEAVESRVVVL